MFDNHNDENKFAFRDFINKKLIEFPDRMEIMKKHLNQEKNIFKFSRDDGLDTTLQ